MHVSNFIFVCQGQCLFSSFFINGMDDRKGFQTKLNSLKIVSSDQEKRILTQFPGRLRL